jgi:hypothetical protein
MASLPDLPEGLVNVATRLRNWGKNQFSLDPQPEQDLISPEFAADTALGFIPGVGQAMALRDMERARRAGDVVQGGMAAASLLPIGKIAGALRKGPKQELIGGVKGLGKDADVITNAAEAAEKAGDDPNKIWRTHGVERGVENHAPWKFEIDDAPAKMKLSPMHLAKEGDVVRKLPDVIDHPELFERYPHLKGTTVSGRMSEEIPIGRSEGSYVHDADPSRAIITMEGHPSDWKSTLLHEIQHGIQEFEGFDTGANNEFIAKRLRQAREKFNSPPSVGDPEWAFQRYLRNMGETEARAVESRLREPSALKKVKPPTESFDLPRNILLNDMDVYSIPKSYVEP